MSENMRKVIDDIKLGNYQSEPVNTNFDYEIKEKPGMFDEVMEKASKTNAYKKYFSTQADVLEEAKTINKETGIPFNAIVAGNVEKAREIYDYKKKQMDPDAVYEAYPGLSKLAQMNENDAAIALHDMENVKMVHGFFEAAKVGISSESLTAERNNLGLDKFMGKAVDEDRLKDIDKELEGLKEIPSLLEAPVESIVGGFAQQAPMMARNLLKGQAYGAAGAVTGFMLGAIGGGVLTGGSASPAFGLQGARIGYSVGSRVGFATEMFKESVGGYYLDYIGYKDKNGNQLLSDDEARNYAAVTALAETGIEMANFDKVLDILKGSKATLPAAKIVENIVKNAKDNASVQAQLKTWLNSNLKNFGTVALTESAEEGVQRMSEMTITKAAQTLNPDGDIPDYSAEDILKGGVEAAYTALPASIGFGGSAVAASGMRFTRQAAQLMTIGKERADEALRTNTGIELVNKLMEAARTTKMGKDHKETFNNLMKANLEGTAHEKAYVDTELLMEQEGGEVVLNQLAAVAGYTEEQLKTFKETGTPIEVNTADYVSTMAGDNQINLSDYISFDAADRCLARNQKVAEEWKKLQNQVNTREVERLIDNINTLTTEMFGETEERDYANQIISEYEDPSAGIAERRRQINLKIDEMILPVVEQMRQGMKKGTSLHFTDDYGIVIDTEDHDSHIGGATRFTNNDMWYSKYYAENKKAPTEQELRELAEEAITGSNPYGIGDFDYSDPDMVAYAEETKAQIDKLRHELELLDSIEGKLKNVDRGEFAALDALTQEGVKVYKEVVDKLRAMPNKAIGRQATMGALIYAHLADRFAAAKRATGDKKYTALDFLKANPIEFGGEAAQGAYNQYGGLQEAEARLKEDEANFAKAIDLFMENKLEGQTTRVMRTPLVMELVGAQVLPVDISVRNLNKILKSKHADDITPELLKQIPRAMTDPLMIFDTYGGKQNQARKVIVLDLKTDNGATVIVPFELNAHNVPGNYTMNAVLSVYGKTDKYTGEASNVWLENQLKESKLQYINKKRASEVLDNEKLLSLIPYLKDGSSSTQIIADEEDLRKLRAMNKGFYQTAWDGAKNQEGVSLAKEVETRLNNSDIARTSKDNNKNNQRIRKWLDEHYPEHSFVFRNNKETGEVIIISIVSKEYEEALKKKRERWEADSREYNLARERFYKRVKTPSGIEKLVTSIEKRLKKDGIEADVIRSRSVVHSLSFYVKTDEKTVKISDHNTIGQQMTYNNDGFIELQSMISVDDVYGVLKRILIGEPYEAAMEKVKFEGGRVDYIYNSLALNQSAWVGSGAIFDKFDVGYIGTGEGGMMHGWGLYSAKNKKVAQKYKKLVGGKKGALYEVDVPEYDVLLDEQKMFKDQEGNVKELLVGAVNNLDHDQKTRFWERVLDRVIEEDSRISMAEFDLIGVELKQAAFNQIVSKFVFARNAARERLLEQGYTEEQINEFVENQDLANKEKTKFDAEIQSIKDNIEVLKKEDERRRLGIMQKAFDNPAESLERIAGEQMYLAFTYAVSGKAYDYRMGSEYLNSQGIKGITYDGAQDGRCFVVFDDKAISVINRFNQAAGQKAKTANLAALQEAMAMYDNYEDDKAIYKKTGWYRGADGKWRFDIPDNFDKIDLSELPDAGYSVQLKDLYDNPALYKAYPWLGEALVTVGELTKGYRGTADSANNVIELSSELVKKGDREIIGIGKARFIRSKTDEETEQWQPLSGEVLSDVERMAIGMITANGNDVDKAIGEAQSEIDKSIESIKFNEANRPNSQMLQIAKQNLVTNKSILETLRGIKQKGFAYTSFPFTDEKKTREEIGKTLMHEIQHLIQDNEGFARGGNPIHVHAQMRRQIDNYRRRALAIDQNAQPYYNRKRDWEAAIIEGASPEKIQALQKELSFLEELVPEEKRQPIIDLLGEADRLERQLKESINPFYDYQNLHGEQEARAASRKAEINTKIKQLETIEVKTLDEILANNIEKVAPENQAAIREWVELNKKFDEATIEEVKKLNERQSEIEAQVKDDEGEQAFFSEYDENFEAEWNKNDIGNLERDYTEEVLGGVSPYNAIVVFGGDVVSGYAVGPKGQTKIKSNGQKVIRLFETADESTFIHEMGHVAYENLRELASQENAPAQFKRDIKTLDNWANWKEGQIDEYVGTATYKEFAARDNAIKEAMASGDEALAEQLKYEWRQERFARGWEEYLKKGKAPTEGLRKVFYQFKKWLTSIYKAYRAIGGAPTKEVEDVMKRMLLTDEAIELAEKKAEIEAFEKSGAFDYLGSDNSKSMWQKILEEIRAEASAKVMKIAMKDMSETAKLEREEKINAEREATRQRMAKEPVWAIYSTLKYNPKASVSAVCKAFNMTVEEYANALKANGGTFERAVDNYMQIYTAELKAPNKQEIEARAEEAVTTSYYKQLLDAFELELLQRKVRQEVRLSKKIAGIVAETEEERAAQEKALRELDKKAEEARSQKALRDVAVGNVETIKNYARQKMAVMPIEYSANPTVWKNASRQKAAEMTAALAKKDYGKAVQAAKMRLTYDAMTDIATENKLFVDRKSKKMRDRAKTVRREKNMAADERYVYFHLLYAFGLAERDVPIPPGYKGFVDTVIAYKEAHDYGLENMSVSFVNNEGQLMMSDFIINAGTGEAVYRKGISELTVSEFKELNDVMDNLYTVAVEASKIKTVTGEDGKTVTIEDAIKEMEEDIAKRRKEPEIKDTTRAGNIHTWDSILDIGNKFHLSLIKAETLLEEMGAAFTKYLYDPIKHAAEKELEMTVEYAKKIEEIKQAWYDGKVVKYMNQGMTEDEARKAADKEFKEMYSAEKYKLGTSTLTKENIIAFALNWGTEANRDRALNYEGTTKAAFERIFAELDGADWQFVMNVWDLFDETWPQVKEVEARVSGVTLEKQEGIAFTITGKDGATYAIQGKYYPIKYDPKKTAKAETYQKEEGLRSKLPSMARMGVGVGMTKERAVKTNYLIRNDLGVFGEAINENIHLITMREAVRDVSRIINDAQFVALMERYMGKNVVPMLQAWALDCWQVEPKVKGELEKAMAYARRKQTMAVLGFRASTALMNVANLAPVTNYLGAARTLDALTNFYAHPQDQYDFVMERSPFMNNRAQTMDRDMRDVIKNKGIMGKKLDWIEQKAFVMLTQSDLMFANPLWLSEYQRVYRENVDKGLAPSVIERMAVDAGDKAVRTVFGSGMVQDLAAVQKGGEVTKMLTMFYSYFSVVYQAISRAYYERRRRIINKEDWLKRNAPVLDLILYWFILPSAMIVATKMGMAWATGDDDEEFTVQNFLIKTGAESLNTAAGTIPILRDVSSMALTYLTEGRYYGARSTPIGELEENVMDVIRSIKGYAEDKKDVDDVVRAVLRGTAYATGLPVVGADGIATIMQWFEYGDATPEEIWQYLAAIMAGKRVEK